MPVTSFRKIFALLAAPIRKLRTLLDEQRNIDYPVRDETEWHAIPELEPHRMVRTIDGTKSCLVDRRKRQDGEWEYRRREWMDWEWNSRQW